MDQEDVDTLLEALFDIRRDVNRIAQLLEETDDGEEDGDAP